MESEAFQIESFGSAPAGAGKPFSKRLELTVLSLGKKAPKKSVYYKYYTFRD
jgi:hypothetical protein